MIYAISNSFHSAMPTSSRAAMTPVAYTNPVAPAFTSDVYQSEKPVYDPELPPRGSFWDRADVRVGAMMAASATVGGGLGGWIAKSAGRSVGGGVALGASLGVVLPVALVYWAMSQWDGR